jgi:hypothetical protein
MACPCKQKLTDEQKDLVNSQSGKSFVQNTTGGQAGGVSSALGQSIGRLGALATAIQTPTIGTVGSALGNSGVDVNRLNKIIADTTNMQSAVNAFKSQADRLSNPQTLMGVIGSMNFYANLGCALGIEGLDVTVSIGVLTGNGQNAISVAGGVQVDLDRIIDNFSRNPSGAGMENAAKEFNTALEGITSKINDATGALNKVTGDSVNMISQAAGAISKYSQINFFSNLIGEANDPCNKMSVAVNQGGLLTPEFQQLAGAANASVASPFASSGSTTTR